MAFPPSVERFIEENTLEKQLPNGPLLVLASPQPNSMFERHGDRSVWNQLDNVVRVPKEFLDLLEEAYLSLAALIPDELADFQFKVKMYVVAYHNMYTADSEFTVGGALRFYKQQLYFNIYLRKLLEEIKESIPEANELLDLIKDWEMHRIGDETHHYNSDVFPVLEKVISSPAIRLILLGKIKAPLLHEISHYYFEWLIDRLGIFDEFLSKQGHKYLETMTKKCKEVWDKEVLHAHDDNAELIRLSRKRIITLISEAPVELKRLLAIRAVTQGATEDFARAQTIATLNVNDLYYSGRNGYNEKPLFLYRGNEGVEEIIPIIKNVLPSGRNLYIAADRVIMHRMKLVDELLAEAASG